MRMMMARRRRRWQPLLMTLLLCSCFLADGYVPGGASLNPLQFITPEVLISVAGTAAVTSVRDIKDRAAKVILGALLPVNQEDALAIFVSEGVSGSLGGLAGKVVSLIDGNKQKRGGALVNAGTYGAYFGVAGAVRSLASISGFSDLAVSLTAFVLATVVSEAFKVPHLSSFQCTLSIYSISPPVPSTQIRSETIVQQRTRAVPGGPSMFELMKFNQPRMRDLMRFQQTEDLDLDIDLDLDDMDYDAADNMDTQQQQKQRRKKGMTDKDRERARERARARFPPLIDFSEAEAGITQIRVLGGKTTRIEVLSPNSLRPPHPSPWASPSPISLCNPLTASRYSPPPISLTQKHTNGPVPRPSPSPSHWTSP